MTQQQNRAASPKRALLVCANPFPMSVATLQQIARKLVSEGAIVDAYNAYPDVVSHLPQVKFRDRFYERTAAKYRRFILPAINGRDLTETVRIEPMEFPPLPETVSELRSAIAYGAKVGLAALSSAASLTKIAVSDKTSHYGSVLVKTWEVAHRAASAATQLRVGHDEIYIFNGRHAHTRPFCDIFEEAGTVIRFEAGAVKNSYILSDGALHDSRNIAHRISNHPIDLEAGAAFFKNSRERRSDTSAYQFTKKQRAGLLPQSLDSNAIVSMFTSSEDEIFAVKDHASFGEFATQFDVAIAVASFCRDIGKTFVLRMHPHLAIKHSLWKQAWSFDLLTSLGAKIVMPDEPIDSYALFDASQAVVTCGSTVGIEAAFAGRPSLMVGEHAATLLGVCSSASNVEEINRFLHNPMALEKARENAVLMASYFQTSGYSIPNLIEGNTIELGRLDGSLIDPVRYYAKSLQRVLSKVPRRIKQKNDR